MKPNPCKDTLLSMLLGESFETLMNAQARLAQSRADKIEGCTSDKATIRDSFQRIKLLYEMDWQLLI